MPEHRPSRRPERARRRIKDAARENHRSMPVVAIPYEPLSEDELLERVRKLREAIDARGGIDARPETIESLIQEGRCR